MYYRIDFRGMIPFMRGYIIKYSGQLYYIHNELEDEFGHNMYVFGPSKKSEDDFRYIINSPDTFWYVQQRTPEKVSFLLLNENTHLVISSIAWRFPIQSMQRCARRFLARRSESRRLALAMALHQRLGGQSQMLEWLNEDTLSKICSCI